MNKVIFWFRRDLRLADNPGLCAALRQGKVLPIYILDEKREKMGEASKCWLHHSLISLNKSLNGNLSIYRGEAEEIIEKLAAKHSINEIFWNRCYEPNYISHDKALKAKLAAKNINAHSFKASLIFEPWEVLKDDNSPYKVFTPFFKKFLTLTPREIESFNFDNSNFFSDEGGLHVDNLKLLPSKNWHVKMMSFWQVGENHARAMLEDFLEAKIFEYGDKRNFPALENISKLSPYLHFGEISPIEIWKAAKFAEEIKASSKGVNIFLSELAWREFAYHLLYHFPFTVEENFQSKFNKFPWQENEDHLTAWKRGMTGFPIIDAAMRELWQTGFMHNRCRMIVASFLTKNLLQHWHKGRDWFDNCLLDADLASNVMGWQWVAGCGVDAAPYFRVFNPIAQAERFDPEGVYIKKYVPELKKLPVKYIYNPAEAPQLILEGAGIVLGKNYPQPIVKLQESRNEALNLFKQL